MPARNSVKPYLENGHYHLYNRGVDKREIFLDDQDYRTFLALLKVYLSPPENLVPEKNSPFKTEKPSRLKRRQDMNLSKDIKLLAYCLMPNHFHVMVLQNIPHGITQLMRRVCTSYVTYFNDKYERSGTLFQGIYKGVLIRDEPHLLHLSRYIHLNPIKTTKFGPLSTVSGSPADYPYSSYRKYLGHESADWLDTSLILSYFQKNQSSLPNPYTSYLGFVEDYRLNSENVLEALTIETETE